MKHILRLHLLAGAIIILFATPVAAQDARSAQTNADEVFDLNIEERRITKINYIASTQVEIGDETRRGVNVRVGVEVRAGIIDVLLRNVTGRVRFRATLAPLLMRIRSHRGPGAPR